MDGIRFALAGGGTRAAFYTLDEAMRGLAASGTLSFGKIKAALAGISPVVYGGIAAVSALTAGGIYLWEEYTSSIHDAEKAAKALEEQMKGIGKIFDQLRNYQKAGLLSPEAIQKYLDLLSGKTPLYKSINNPGQLTTNPTETVQVQQSAVVAMMPQSSKIVEQQMQLLKASAAEVQKYIQDDIAVQGKLTESMVEAAAKHKELLDKIHTESLSAADQEKAKIHEKYQAERDEIKDTAVNMGSLMTPKGASDDAAAKALTVQKEIAEQRAIDAKQREEDEKKAAAAFAEGQKMFAQQVAEEDKKLDAELTLSAAKQGKTREQIYEQEYEAWLKLKTGQLFAGEITSKQYDEFLQAALVKRLDGANRESKEIEAIRNRLALAGTSDLKRQETEINQRYDAEIAAVKKLNVSLQEQLQLIQQIDAARNADLEKARKDAANEQQLHQQKYQSLTMMFAVMMGQKKNLSEKEKEAEDRIDAEREQGVMTMLGNMATAAKAYGQEGLAAYKAFAIAQAVIDTAKGAIAAYTSVVGIPYVGPILAPIAAAAAVAAGAAQISQIESAGAREHGGPVEEGMPYVVGEAGRELFIPNSSGRIVNANDTARMFDRSGGQVGSGGTNLKQAIHFWDDPRRMEKEIRDNPDIHHTIVDVMKRNAHQIRGHG